MERVWARPEALLDNAKEPSKLTRPASDAERYQTSGSTLKNVGDFLAHLFFLSEDEVPRVEETRTSVIEDHAEFYILGEKDLPGDPEITYGFGIKKDELIYVEVSRITDGVNKTVLGYLDTVDLDSPKFYNAQLEEINDPAKIDELSQLINIAYDEAQWALD